MFYPQGTTGTKVTVTSSVEEVTTITVAMLPTKGVTVLVGVHPEEVELMLPLVLEVRIVMGI